MFGCKAGLAESCSHIASVLFYLEAWTKVNRRLSCAQIKCPWILILKCANEEFSLIKLFCSIFLKFEWEIMFLYVLPRLFYRPLSFFCMMVSNSRSSSITMFIFFRGHSNESCNLIGSLPGQYFPISAHGPQYRFCESLSTSQLSLPFFINISGFSGGAIFLIKHVGHNLKPINNLRILPFLSLKSLLREGY